MNSEENPSARAKAAWERARSSWGFLLAEILHQHQVDPPRRLGREEDGLSIRGRRQILDTPSLHGGQQAAPPTC